jgi:hypothetical protein
MKISKKCFCKENLMVCGSKNIFLNHYVQNCGGAEKVNLGIFPFLGAKYA